MTIAVPLRATHRQVAPAANDACAEGRSWIGQPYPDRAWRPLVDGEASQRFRPSVHGPGTVSSPPAAADCSTSAASERVQRALAVAKKAGRPADVTFGGQVVGRAHPDGFYEYVPQGMVG
jgi:hypothetical protein